MHNPGAGRWKLALKMLKQMRRDKVAPDTVTFSSAIAACGSAGEWQRALLLLPLMASAGVSPNTITFSSCITACEKKGEWRPALQVLETMATLDLAPDLICCNAAIGACARAGEPAQAQTVLREVLAANGITPDTKSYNGNPTPNPNSNPNEVCTLDAEVVAGCGNFVDKNSMQYHCETEYFPPDADADGLPDREATYGCASNDLTLAPILT